MATATGEAGQAAPPELRPGLPHLLRALERYVARLGTQFAGAITYFSVLAVVPILLLAFSVAGIVLTVSRPDLLVPVADAVAAAVADAVGSADPGTRQKVSDLTTNALSNWRGTIVAGLVFGIYSGAGWMTNLKNAVRAQWRPEFDLRSTADAGNIVVATLRMYAVNFAQLWLLILAILVTFGLASLSTSLADTVLDALGLSQISLLRPVLRLVPVIFSIAAGFVLFLFLYTVLPETREPSRVVRRGALVAAVGLAVLQYLGTFLVARFSVNPAFAVFGSVIALMLFLNLFAQLILFMAAWIGTAHHPVVERTDLVPGPVPSAVPPSLPAAAEPSTVGRRTSYLTGAATGVGIGAALVWLTARRRASERC